VITAGTKCGRRRTRHFCGRINNDGHKCSDAGGENAGAGTARDTGSLKSKQVDKLVRAGKPGNWYDGQGLRLEIKGKKAASWISRYQIDGKVKFMGLGSARAFGLAEARERNRRLVRQKLADGIDPLLTRQTERAAQQAAAAKAVTFGEACRRYLEQHSAKWDSPKHRAQWQYTLDSYAGPIIGQLSVADIDVPLVLKVLEQPIAATRGNPAGPLWQVRTETANRLRSRIENVLDWCKGRGYRSGDNPANWGIIAKVLPAPPAKQHHPALPYKDAPEFMAGLRAREGVDARATEFLILTAGRSQEVLKARWSEFDLDAGIWNVPAERMKARKPHRVPLAPGVITLLRNLYREGDDGFVFIGAQAGRPLSHTVFQRLLKRLGQDVTPHGFRSAFRDWAGETTAFPHDVCEAALAHVRGDQSVQAYARGDLFDRRRKLMEAWAKFCAGPPVKRKASGVVALRRP
jgi:integrase